MSDINDKELTGEIQAASPARRLMVGDRWDKSNIIRFEPKARWSCSGREWSTDIVKNSPCRTPRVGRDK